MTYMNNQQLTTNMIYEKLWNYKDNFLATKNWWSAQLYKSDKNIDPEIYVGNISIIKSGYLKVLFLVMIFLFHPSPN